MFRLFPPSSDVRPGYATPLVASQGRGYDDIFAKAWCINGKTLSAGAIPSVVCGTFNQIGGGLAHNGDQVERPLRPENSFA